MTLQVITDIVRFGVLGRLRGRTVQRYSLHSARKITWTIYAMFLLTVILGAMVEQTAARVLQLPLHYRFSAHNAYFERPLPVRHRRDIVKVHVPPPVTDYDSLMGRSGQGYYITVHIGTPPQTLNVLVDTGSSNFAVAAYPDPLLTHFFDSKSSSTLEKLGLTVSVPYTQGNWTGPLVQDRVALSILPNVSVPAMFAAISLSQGFFINDSNWQGILGLAYAKIARPDSSVVPYFDSLVESTDVADVFSMQFCGTTNQPAGSGSLSMTGTMTIGGIDSSLYEGPLFTTPIFREWYYEITIADMGVGGHSLNMDCKEYNFDKTIVDSGTTNLRLPMKVYTELVSRIQRLVVLPGAPISPSPHFWQGLDCLCWPRGNVPFHSFPSISITLSHKHDQVFTLPLSSQQYLRPVVPTPGREEQDCFKFAISSSDSGTVLGAVLMEGFYTVFNRANRTIGFAKSTCGVKEPNSPTSAIQGLFKYQGNSTQCAYMRPSQDDKQLVIVAYVMAGVCALCILPLVALVIQLQVRRRCGHKQRRLRSDESDVRPLHDD